MEAEGPMTPPMQPYQAPPPPKRRVRFFTWFILLVNILFLVWFIVAMRTVDSSTCDGLNTTDCEGVKSLGGGVGGFLIIFIWLAVDVVLGIIWIVTRRRQPTVVYVQQPPPPPPMR